MKENVSAGVVTFNRLDFLKEVIHSLKNQTRKPDEIFVINNSSTDGTSEWLAQQEGITVITQDNTGSSGGQYTSLKTAFDKGYDWLWIMDDDVVPENDCLEKLLEPGGKDIIRAPLRYTPKGEPFYNDTIKFNMSNPFSSIWVEVLSPKHLRNNIIEAEGITFEGPLMHRSIIEKIGLPEKKFFIYADDSEYFIRAKNAGAKCIIVKKAKMRRKLECDANLSNFTWKNFYIIRNIIAIDVLHGNFAIRTIRPFGYLFSWLRRSKNLKNAAAVFKAFFSGYFYKSEN